MITEQQIPQVLDHPLFDNHGSKVGDVRHVFLDDATGRPEWLCVRTGLFHSKETFVPTNSAELVSDHIEVNLDKDYIKHAPNVDVDAGGHLSAAEERELYRYYGIDWNAPAAGGPAATAGPSETVTGRTGVPPGPTGTAGAAGTAGTAGAAAGRPTAGGPAPVREPTRERRTREEERGEAMTRSEERLRIGKETHESGRARLRKYVVTEQQQATIPVSHEEVRLEREPITETERGAATAGSEISEAEAEFVLHEEQPVVSKETIPVERVRATKETVTEQRTVGGEVRKEHIELEEESRDPSRRDRDRKRGGR